MVAPAVSSTHTIACGVMCTMMLAAGLINSNRQPGKETDVGRVDGRGRDVVVFCLRLL